MKILIVRCVRCFVYLNWKLYNWIYYDSGNNNENSDENQLNDEENQNPDQLCAKCGQHFTSLIDLVHHFFKEHKKPGEDFDCPMCPKIISLKYSTSKASVMEHMRNTHLKETKKCPDCKQILKLSGYRKHRRQVHGIYFKRSEENLTPVPNPDGQYECPACKKVCGTKKSKCVLTLPFNLTNLIWVSINIWKLLSRIKKWKLWQLVPMVISCWVRMKNIPRWHSQDLWVKGWPDKPLFFGWQTQSTCGLLTQKT